MYNQTILNNFIQPTNAGGLHGANGVAKCGAAGTSDIIKLYLKVEPETEIIEEAHFKTYGCPVAIACSNVICDMVKGRRLEDAEQIESVDICKVLGGIPAEKVYCAITAEEAIKGAIKNYRKNAEKLEK